jgi:hypothetical protein
VSIQNVREILRVPGKLYANPTGFMLPADFGTPLGIVHDVALRLEQSYQFVTAEEYGNQRVEGTQTTSGCALGFVLRGWDKDCIERIFPNTASGSFSGKRRVVEPSTIRPGERLSNRSIVLLFAPDDRDRHPMFVMRRALPALEETAEIRLHMDEDFGLPVVFYAIRDANAKLFDWGMAHDVPPTPLGYGYNYGFNYGM